MDGGVMEEKQQRSSSASAASSYTYWVREVTGDAAPLPVHRKLSAEDLSKQQSTALGSPWNQAGTWEEKNLNTWATNRIKELLLSLGCMEFSKGKADIHEVSNCVGDAFLVTVRNKKRVGYTFEVTLRFKGEWMINEEKKKIDGYLDVPEFTFGELEDLQIDVRIREDKDLAGGDGTGIINDMKSILPAIREKLLKFEQELKDSSVVVVVSSNRHPKGFVCFISFRETYYKKKNIVLNSTEPQMVFQFSVLSWLFSVTNCKQHNLFCHF